MKSLILGLMLWKSLSWQLWLVLLATFRADLDPRFLFSKSEKVWGLGLWVKRNLLAQREQHFKSDWRGHKIVQINLTWITKHKQQVQLRKIRIHKAIIPKGPKVDKTFDSWSILLPSETISVKTQKIESRFWHPTSRKGSSYHSWFLGSLRGLDSAFYGREDFRKQDRAGLG